MDANKCNAGICGCGVVDDGNGDGCADCIDVCPNDPNKCDDAGSCGCGVPETDIDGDGFACDDNCPEDYNPGQENQDGDIHGDVCDICPGHDDNDDADGDGVPKGCDNCPYNSNPDQDPGVCAGQSPLLGEALAAYHFPTAATTDLSGHSNDGQLRGFSISGEGLLQMSGPSPGKDCIRIPGSAGQAMASGSVFTVYIQKLTTTASHPYWFALGHYGPGTWFLLAQTTAGWDLGECNGYWTDHNYVRGECFGSEKVTDGRPHDVFWVYDGIWHLYDGPGNEIAGGGMARPAMANESLIGGVGDGEVYGQSTSLGGTCEAMAVWDKALSTAEMQEVADSLFGGPTNDDDGDGVPNDIDNCPQTSNVDQADCDEDGAGNACDGDRGPDDDADGLAWCDDNCPETSNADQADGDSDGVGNACDNCPCTPNPDQGDDDSDGLGNACIAYGPAIPQTGLEAAFDFSKGIFDLSGNENHAQLRGFSIDPVNQVLDMSGPSSNSIRMSGNAGAVLVGGGNWTIYLGALTTSNENPHWFSFGTYISGAEALWQLVQGGTSAGTPYWAELSYAGGSPISGGTVTDGAAHEVFWVKSGETLTLYDGPGNTIATGIAFAYRGLSGTADIGGNGGREAFWQNTSLGGTMDSMAVYNRPLSTAEMQQVIDGFDGVGAGSGGSNEPDGDEDGVADCVDNCPTNYNPSQIDICGGISCQCPGDMSGDGWLSPADVSAVVSELLPYASNAYWKFTPGHCSDLNEDGWLSPPDVSSLVTNLLPQASNAYWKQCPQP